MSHINKKKILVVDDNPVMVKLMTNFLEREGHMVSAATDSFCALKSIKKMTPDIIFIDLVMPRIGGEDLCRIFRDLPQLRQCFLVIVSAVALEKELDFKEMGADACIAKGPFDIMASHLREVIMEADNPVRPEQSVQIKGTRNLHSRQVTKELLNQNHHLNIILESMSQGVLEMIDQRVVYFNQAALYFLKISKEKLLGSYFHECLEEDLWEKIAPVIDICGDKMAMETERPSIEIHDRQIILQCLKVKKEPGHRIVLLTDITERKQMEAVIEATNLAENLGYIFSGIRHEIGNPVGSIKMALGVLKKNMDSYDRKTVSEFVDRSLEEVSRIEYLLKALKNYSLFESPKIKMNRLDLFMENFISLIKNDFDRKNLTIKTIIDKKIKYAVFDDRALHHVMLNLITNSVDALSGVESPMLMIQVKRSHPWIEIKVDDNGTGIPEPAQKNLFKPFFTSKAKGTGLGLVIVKKMLLKMNSRISIQSYENFGTTVTIEIPER